MNADGYSPSKGDNNTYVKLWEEGYSFCRKPQDIQCRDPQNTFLSYEMVKQPTVECDLENGLLCDPSLLPPSIMFCNDYEIKVKCCECLQQTTASIETDSTTTESFVSSTATLSNIRSIDPNTQPTIIINENWIPALIITFVMLLLIGVISFVICRRKRKKSCTKRSVAKSTKIYQNKVFEFSKFTLFDAVEDSRWPTYMYSHAPSTVESFRSGRNPMSNYDDDLYSARSFSSRHQHQTQSDNVPHRWIPDDTTTTSLTLSDTQSITDPLERLLSRKSRASTSPGRRPPPPVTPRVPSISTPTASSC